MALPETCGVSEHSIHKATRLIGKQKFKLIALLAGLGLFVLLIARTGPGVIAARIWQVGAGFLFLILISGFRHVLRTIAWYRSIEPGERQVRFLDLFGIRLVGEAVTDLTFLGPLLGETVKGLTLSRRISPEHSASSVVIENLAYSFATGLIIASGLALFVSEFALPSTVRTAGLAVLLVLFLVGSTVGLIVKKRYKVVGRVLDGLERLRIGWGNPLQERREQVDRFEENIHDFCRRHKAESLLILLVEILAIFTGVLEAYIILSLTVHRSSFLAAFIIEAVNRVVNLFFSFVPLRMGVDEGGTALVVNAVGYSAAEGVSLAIIRKIRTLFWVGVGLLLAAHYSVALRGSGDKNASPIAASK